MESLRIGQLFPELRANTVDGRAIAIPADLNGSPAVLLFYRGHW
ncbi:MAG TPA: hypothetical protein VH559_15910 [Gemmatimonadaceae bacterium]|jgi:peroxiredoxin